MMRNSRQNPNSSISYGIQLITQHNHIPNNILRQLNKPELAEKPSLVRLAARFAGTDRFSLEICVRGDRRNQFALDVP